MKKRSLDGIVYTNIKALKTFKPVLKQKRKARILSARAESRKFLCSDKIITGDRHKFRGVRVSSGGFRGPFATENISRARKVSSAPAAGALFLDSIRKPTAGNRVVASSKIIRQTFKRRQNFGFQEKIKGKFKFFFRQKYSLPAFIILFLIAFSGGMVTVLSTPSSKAEEFQGQVLGASTVAIPLSPTANLGPVNTVPNEVLFNLKIGQIESYLEEALKTDEVRAAERLALRKQKLAKYLAEKKSPFVEIVDTIAGLKHWKMVLAISNSESTLGKRCYSNNCSGIGVEPGHPLWREYSTTADWAKDLNNLLERRYKNWTLEEMNGVYNQPGSRNWLLASRQILEELQERGIE